MAKIIELTREELLRESSERGILKSLWRPLPLEAKVIEISPSTKDPVTMKAYRMLFNEVSGLPLEELSDREMEEVQEQLSQLPESSRNLLSDAYGIHGERLNSNQLQNKYDIHGDAFQTFLDMSLKLFKRRLGDTSLATYVSED